MSRYDLTDFEWRVITPLLPNKPRGVPRVDDRRVLNGIFWCFDREHHDATYRNAMDRVPPRSRGGLTTNIHVVVDAHGLPIRLSIRRNSSAPGVRLSAG
ncbi:Putative transposase of IS4/5 family [Bradyrhizobium erythrophlei]|uniref:Putative transposase of IS4/5 family n=1 Tax=Bradyrhizobium erythrophlei TaxID=1437360 RepID=A0A1H4MTE6_9BRAD|nr:Putative transposase of IS4/5 family [Bradyrhizobium erythrophlei]